MSCECSLTDGLHATWCPARPRRELVRCGCGVVRNDEDPEIALMVPDSRAYEVIQKYERPRICRQCGSLYALPKQQPPTEPEPQ